jgi:hypothetical protein
MFLSDKVYLNARSVKLGQKQIPDFYRDLADYISQTYQVTVLYVSHSRWPNEAIEVVLDKKSESERFYDLRGLLDEPQEVVLKKLHELVIEKGSPNPNVDLKKIFLESDIYISFDDLESSEIAKMLDRIPFETLKETNEPYVWKFIPSLDFVLCLYYLDSDIEKHKLSGLSEKIKREFLTLVKQYDELNYITEQNNLLIFDSKSNFQRYDEFHYFHDGKWIRNK